MRKEIGGPGDLSCTQFARQYQMARGMDRAILPVRVSPRIARRMQFVVAQGARGALSWSTWLERQFPLY
jgi:hypothetical protein